MASRWLKSQAQGLTLTPKSPGEVVSLYPTEALLLLTDVSEYYGAAEPPVRGGVSHLSGQTEPPKNYFPSERDLIL